MQPRETLNTGSLFFFNEDTNTYKKFVDVSGLDDPEPDQDVVLVDLSKTGDFTATFTLKPPVVVDAEYKEVGSGNT